MVLGVEKHKRMCHAMSAIAAPVDKWHGEGNAACRSVQEHVAWFVGQSNGGYMQHVEEIHKVFCNLEVLHDCGFYMFIRASPEEKVPIEIGDAGMAALLGSMVLTLMGLRIKRALWFLSLWCLRLSKVLVENVEVQSSLLQEFQHDFEVFEALNAVAAKPRVLVTMLARSVFHLTSVKQFVAGGKLGNWKDISGFKELMTKVLSGFVGSQIVEDEFAMMKNHGQVRGSKKCRRPQAAMGAALAGKVVSGRHRYDTVQPRAPAVRKTVRLDPSAFGKPLQDASVDLSGFVGTNAKVPWFSPGVDSLGVPAADIHACRFMHDTKVYDPDFSLGSFVNSRHFIVFRRSAPFRLAFDWHIGLFNYNDTAAAAWPVQIACFPVQAAGPNIAPVLYVKFGECIDPVFLPICDWTGITGHHYYWASWGKQSELVPLLSTSCAPAVRMLIDGPEIPLKQLAAERAWFTLGVADIDNIASHLRAPPDVKSHDGTLLDAGVKLTQHVLQCGEGKALDIMSQRIKVMDDSCTVIDEFMELDEAANNLTAEDEKKTQDREGGPHGQTA